MTETIVQKGTSEFKDARNRFIALFEKTQPKATVLPGGLGMKTTQSGSLPRPFSCPDLEIYIWKNEDGSASIGFFCGRIGCICSPAREDMDETYPSYCPDEMEPWSDEEGEEDWRDDEYDEEDIW